MQRLQLDEVAQALTKVLYSEDRALGLRLLQLLAKGQPVAPERLASALGRSSDEVRTALRRLPSIEFDARGHIVGSGLSLVPTPHHFQIGEHALYTWCALDTLMYPLLLQQSAQVVSSCPETKTMIRFTVLPEGVTGLQPQSAVINVVLPDRVEGCRDVRGKFCNHVYFFSSPEVASTWLAQRQGTLVFSVDEAFQLARMIVKQRYEGA